MTDHESPTDHLADDPERGIRWIDDLEEARDRSRRDGKPVFLASASRKKGACDSQYY